MTANLTVHKMVPSASSGHPSKSRTNNRRNGMHKRAMNTVMLLVVVGILAATTTPAETLAFRDVPRTQPQSSSSIAKTPRFVKINVFRRQRPSQSAATVAASPSTMGTAAATASSIQEQQEKSPGEDNGNATNDQTSLTFRGEVSFDSKSMPIPSSPEHLSKFFSTPSSRNLLVTGGGERPCTELEVTPDLLDEWRTKCETLGACRPEQGDSIVSITTPGLSFPGLSVKNIAKVGTKYVEDGTTTPRHEFVLLSNDSEASGLPPVVWLYNKLTGGGGGGNGNGVESDTTTTKSSNTVPTPSSSGGTNIKSLSTVSYERKDDGIVFRTNASLSIGLKFPKFLMKALGDKSKAEQVGAKSIRKTLDKDVAQSMSAFEKAYLSFLDSMNNTA